MRGGGVRVALVTLDVFVAVSAIGGGIAVATGVDRFPAAWLSGTPFRSYLFPGLILATWVEAGYSVIGLVMVVLALRVGRAGRLVGS
jgi:hypothetical protein